MLADDINWLALKSAMVADSKVANLEGAWLLESYVRDGVETTVTGTLILAEGYWSTLYFLPASDAGGDWGSAESGRYIHQDDCLTFYHQFRFQGGGGQPVVIDLSSTVVEACRITLTALNLTIDFPSGSVIRCRRQSE
jgi:hypothetical protein